MNPIARWFRKRDIESDLSAELSDHLAEMIDDLRDHGLSEEEARALANRRLGNTTMHIENSRSVWVYVGELPARQMIEFGHLLPEAGDEPAWTAALPAADREFMQSIGK